MRWIESWRADPVARELADRHYNRQKVGSKQFVPPGRCIVLVTHDQKAFWISSFPIAKYVKHAWAGAWMCTAFRNEGAGLSSELITEAVAATLWLAAQTPSWCEGEPGIPTVPHHGFVSFVDPVKTRAKSDPGYCYLKAGWTRLEERTQEDNLVVYQLLPRDFPPAAPPRRRRKTMNTSLAISPSVQAELTTEADRLKPAMSQIGQFVIDSQLRYTQAGELLQFVKARWAELEEKRTSITKPLNEALRNVNALFSPVQGPLKQAELILKTKIGNFIVQQQQLQEQAMRQAAAAIQQSQPAIAAQAMAAMAPVTQVQGISVKPEWDYEIVDPDAVPRNYCSPDHNKIKAALPNAIHHEKLTPQIPGIRFWIKGSVTARQPK